jgi:nitrate/nitrite transport system substrate-binding protein
MQALVWQVLLQWHNFNAETAMSGFDNPYDPETDLSGCSCGAHASQAAHDASAAGNDTETLSARFVESSLVRALFPHDETRRNFIRAVGAGTAKAAIASLLPIGSLTAMAQDKAPLEKKDLKIGFIPITCATPLIMA